MLAKLRQAMAELSDSDREVIELRHHGGMSFREIAEMLDQPLGTLLARHHRALRKLKQLMGQEIEDL
jgi:RNA polymerase sigma-70 factor, ECF subfamily